jgi:hypothetical protein
MDRRIRAPSTSQLRAQTGSLCISVDHRRRQQCCRHNAGGEAQHGIEQFLIDAFAEEVERRADGCDRPGKKAGQESLRDRVLCQEPVIQVPAKLLALGCPDA